MTGFRVTIRSSWADTAATVRWLERNGLSPRWQVVEVLCDAEGSALILRHLRPVEVFCVDDKPAGFVMARHRVPLRHLPPPHIIEAGGPTCRSEPAPSSDAGPYPGATPPNRRVSDEPVDRCPPQRGPIDVRR